jgi:hypothetical protein
MQQQSSTHTPGPWHLEDGLFDRGKKTYAAAVFSDAYAATIADIRLQYTPSTHQRTGHDESLANARLIAAAPELLEAARLGLAWLDYWRDRVCLFTDEHAQACDQLRAAIARAAGQEVQ